MYGRLSIRVVELQAEVLGCGIVDNNVDVELHHEYEDGAVEGKGFYNQMYATK